MLVEGASSILQKIFKYMGGRPKLDISHACFSMLCFAFGILFSYVLVEDGVAGGLSYPANNMSLQDVATLVDIDAKVAGGGKNYEKIAAISAMQMVNAFVSDYRVKAAKNIPDIDSYRGNGAEKGWYLSAGFCDVKAYAMVCIMQYLQIPVREIQFWHINGESIGHAACEVYYADSWHYFDPTWGLYFLDSANHVLALDEILNLPKEEAYSCLVMNHANVRNALEIFEYSLSNLLETEAEIAIAGNSRIIYDFRKNTSLVNIPTYIGIRKNWSGEKCEAKFTIVFDDGMKEIKVSYAHPSELKGIDFIDNNGHCIHSVDLNGCSGVFTIGEEMLSHGSVTLQANNKDEYALLFIKNIEGIYKDGSKICAQ